MKKNPKPKFQIPNLTYHLSLITCHLSSKRTPGQVLIIALVFLAVVLIIASSLFSRVANFIRFGSNSVLKEQATQLADAGVDYAVQQLNETTGSYTGDTQTLSIGTVTVTVANKGQNLKTITSTGYIPNQTSPRAKRTVKVDIVIDSQLISFRYAVQVNEGGLDMANSSLITGVGGTKATVFSKGNINGSGSSTINGDAYTLGTISSPDPTVTGIKCEGQTPPLPCADPTELSEMPAIDETDWLAEADANPLSCPCTISGDTSIGPRKYTGDLTISNNAIVTVNGPIHVTGNFRMTQGGTTLKLNDSFGSNGTGFIVDGIVDLSQGGKFEPTNGNPKGYLLVISHSDTSGALQISQSGSTAIFYALDGRATMSQSAHVSALVAKQLTLSQSATLEYDQGLASANFTSGPGGGWVLKRGTYKFTSSP